MHAPAVASNRMQKKTKKKRNIPFHVGNVDHETVGMNLLHCLCGSY